MCLFCSLVQDSHMSTTTTSVTEKLFVSELFLQNTGGGSGFIGRDDFQNTLSARQAWQSRTLMAHHVLKLRSLKQSPYGLTVEPAALRADIRLCYQVEMSCRPTCTKSSSEVSNVEILIPQINFVWWLQKTWSYSLWWRLKFTNAVFRPNNMCPLQMFLVISAVTKPAEGKKRRRIV